MSVSINSNNPLVSKEANNDTQKVNVTPKVQDTPVKADSLKKDNIQINKKESVLPNPYDTSNEGRKVLQPIGKSNGQNFYFMYGLERTFDKIAMRGTNKIAVQDDILRLRSKGYTVIVDDKMTTADFKNAYYDPKAAGVVTLSHGGEGDVVTIESKDSPEGYISYRDIETNKVSKNLKLAFIQACQVGMEQKNWDKAIGQSVIAWNYSVSNVEVLASNSHLGSAAVFPVVGAVFSIKTQNHGKALGKLIGERF